MTQIIISDSYTYSSDFKTDPVHTNDLANFKFTGGSNWSICISGNYKYARTHAKKMYKQQFDTAFGEIVLVSATKVKIDIGNNVA